MWPLKVARRKLVGKLCIMANMLDYSLEDYPTCSPASPSRNDANPV